MTVSEHALWAGVLLSLASIAHTLISARSKAAYSKVRDLEQRLEQKADAAVVAALAGKVDILEDRSTRIETEMNHLPDKDTAHKLEVSLSELNGKVEMLTERLAPVTAMASRIQDVLIERMSTS